VVARDPDSRLLRLQKVIAYGSQRLHDRLAPESVSEINGLSAESKEQNLNLVSAGGDLAGVQFDGR
jgi:hypothetical protein